MSTRTIPVVDLQQYISGNDEEKAQFVKQLGEAFHNVGFVGVRNHGVPKDLIENFYRVSKDFFSQSVDVKKSYEIEGMAGQRGYTSFGKEHAKHSNVGDLKEFYQIGQFIPEGHPFKADYPDNPSVTHIAGFNEYSKDLYKNFENSGRYLLRAIAEHLELPVDYFDEKITDGNSILRTIHYPPITDEPKSAIRAEQHEDINLITLLVGASAGGLQLLDAEDNWLDITPEEDELVINVGDMLQRLTNNYLKSTTHRVVNPPKEKWHIPRLSIPFFLHPKADMPLDCLDSCVTAERPLAYQPITAGAYLNERLEEIGLKAIR